MLSISKAKRVALAAMAQGRVIGKEGKLPWHYPEDLAFFKTQTLGRTLIMGRKTWDSLPGFLPGRHHIVLSRSHHGEPRLERSRGEFSLFLAATKASALSLAESLGDAQAVIGGAEIYRLFLPECEEVLLTYIDRQVEGDAFFPVFEEDFVMAESLDSEAHEDLVYRRYRRRTNV